MVKALFLSIILSSSLLAQSTMANPKFSATEMAKYQVTQLDFANILQKFYPNQTQKFILNEESQEEIADMPYIGLKEAVGKLADEDNYHQKYQTIAVMHPVQTYKNAKKQARYMVLIEKVVANKADKSLMTGSYIMDASGDLYIFQKVKNGYQLVTRTPKNIEFNAVYGRLTIDLPELAKSLRPVGNNVQGRIEYTVAREVIEEKVTINENQYIQFPSY